MYFLKAAEPYVDTIQISSGIDKIFEANIHCITTNMEETMPNLKWAKEARKQLHVPISLVSAITTPQMAEEILAKGYVDLVAFGRSLLAGSLLAEKSPGGMSRGYRTLPALLQLLSHFHRSLERGLLRKSPLS